MTAASGPSRPSAPSGVAAAAGDRTTLEVRGGRPLRGELAVPGDKSISHRALLLAALAPGRSVLTGLSTGDDVARTRAAVAALGALVTGVAEPGGHAEDAGHAGSEPGRTGDAPPAVPPGGEGMTVVVDGGRDRLGAPGSPLDLGNSGTGLRLLAGVAATLPGTTVLDGDDSLRQRPMDRIALPLEAMGARCRGRGAHLLPPLEIDGGDLVGIEYTPPVASAQVKSAILLAGLAARGETVVHEPVPTRAHTEEMLTAMGADVVVERRGSEVTIRLRPSELRARDVAVPGDPSQAAFWVVAGLVVPDSRITVTGVHLGAERVGFLGVLRRMGAQIDVAAVDDGGGATGLGHLTAVAGDLEATEVEAGEIPSLDEVPVLAVAAAVARGTTRFHDVGELRVKESDRLVGTAALVEAFGARSQVEGDDLVVHGVGGVEGLRPGRVDVHGDHRMAMAAAVAGAACPGGGPRPTVITGWDTVASSYPGFADRLAGLGAECATS